MDTATVTITATRTSKFSIRSTPGPIRPGVSCLTGRAPKWP
jgi:hypothetical protein